MASVPCSIPRESPSDVSDIEFTRLLLDGGERASLAKAKLFRTRKLGHRVVFARFVPTTPTVAVTLFAAKLNCLTATRQWPFMNEAFSNGEESSPVKVGVPIQSTFAGGRHGREYLGCRG
jgi:hypothetical protein